MAIEEIPKAYLYRCDVCGLEHMQKNASGHYHDSRPPRWARLTLAQDGEDYQGQGVADGTVTRLLCRECRDGMSEAINAATAALRKRERRND